MAAGDLRIPKDIMTGQSDDYHKLSHIACACSAHLNLCGGIEANVGYVEILSPDDENEPWCPSCFEVWMSEGCLRCPCGPYKLCEACRSSKRPATD